MIVAKQGRGAALVTGPNTREETKMGTDIGAPIELVEGTYYDPIRGILEDFRYEEGKRAPDEPTIAPNTIRMIGEVSRGYVGHDVVVDDALNVILCVGVASDTNPNDRWVTVYKNPPGDYTFDGNSPTQISQPVLKIDIVQATKIGPHLLVSTTTHAPREAPRDTWVEGSLFQNILTYIPPYKPPKVEREGPCVPPLNLPYYRPGNNLTRGQLSKIIIEAFRYAGIKLPDFDPNKQYFEDVPIGSTFHEPTALLNLMGAIGGYACTPTPAP